MLAWAALLAGCGTGQPDASRLALMGQAASEAVGQQTGAARDAVRLLPVTVTLNAILACASIERPQLRAACIDGAPANAQPGAFKAAQQNLVSVLNQRAAAMDSLTQAYQAFGRLADYDAGQAAADAVDRAFASINSLSQALAVFGPPGTVAALVSPAITGMVADAGFLFAEMRRARLVMAASRDLHAATDALIALVTVERDSAAIRSLLAELDQERTRLEMNALRAGFIPPLAVLAPTYSQLVPSAPVPAVTGANADLARAGALYLISARASERQRLLDASYGQALGTLVALSKEHGKFEAREMLDASAVYEGAKRLAQSAAALK